MRFLIVFFIVLSGFCFGQSTQIYPDFYDTLPEGYSFHLTGTSELNDSCVIKVEVRDTLNNLLLSAQKDFSTTTSDFSVFNYNPQDGVFYCELGVFPSNSIEIWFRVYKEAELKEELLLVEFEDKILNNEE